VGVITLTEIGRSLGGDFRASFGEEALPAETVCRNDTEMRLGGRVNPTFMAGGERHVQTKIG